MQIRIASPKDIPAIHQLAPQVWWPTYESILSAEQISFMLDKMYSEEALKLQFEEGGHFAVAERDNQAVAFASWSCTEPGGQLFKLHKIYISPSEQGKGTGRKLIAFVENDVRKKGGKILELNVNRHNSAFGFYKKIGFELFREDDIPYYHFFMNDYIMRKPL